MLRRRNQFNQKSTPPNYMNQNHIGSASVIMIIIGLGLFFHALQWR